MSNDEYKYRLGITDEALEALDLMEELEDAEDGRRLEEAIKRNKNKPLIPWEEAKKRLDLA
jgi:hypothetical protein